MVSTQSKGSDWGITAFFTSSAIVENLVALLHYKMFVPNCMCPSYFGKEQANSDKMAGKILGKQPKFGHWRQAGAKEKTLTRITRLKLAKPSFVAMGPSAKLQNETTM